MSARRRKRAPRVHGADAGRSGPRAPARLGAPLAALALVTVLAVLAIRGHRAAPGTPPAPAALDPEAAARRADQLTTQKEWRASLPYYRRALEGEPGREWRTHFNCAIVLDNLTIQFVERAGRQVPATRSSAERVQLACESLDEFASAVRMAPDGATRAKILAFRGNMLARWGFPWEAFACFRAAQQADSTRRDLAARADEFLEVIRDPTRFQFVQPDSSNRFALP